MKRLQNTNSKLNEERFAYYALKASEEEGELIITFLEALVFLQRRYGKTIEEAAELLIAAQELILREYLDVGAEYITEYVNAELDSEG